MYKCNRKAGLAAHLNESQTREKDAGAKGKKFIQVEEQRTPVSKTICPSCLSPVLIEIGRGRFFSIQLSHSFLTAGALTIRLSGFWHAGCKTLPVPPWPMWATPGLSLSAGVSVSGEEGSARPPSGGLAMLWPLPASQCRWAPLDPSARAPRAAPGSRRLKRPARPTLTLLPVAHAPST